MKRILLLGLLLGLAIFAFSGLGGPSAGDIETSPAASSKITPKPTYPNAFFDPLLFTGISEKVPEDVDKPISGELSRKVRGAVVPHHLLAHELIAEVFERLSEDPPALMVLIGPNHFNLGSKILTSSWGWQTPFGILEADGDMVAQLMETGLAAEEPEVFAREHSMGNLMPFIKHYLPEAKVVPIILHHDVGREEAWALAEKLSTLADKGGVIVASVDFSHYLTRKGAEIKDLETLEALRAGNLGKIFSMGNDHLDSPAAMGTLIYSMKKLGIEDFTLLDNTNSGIILGNDMIETTSYITLVYEEESGR